MTFCDINIKQLSFVLTTSILCNTSNICVVSVSKYKNLYLLLSGWKGLRKLRVISSSISFDINTSPTSNCVASRRDLYYYSKDSSAKVYFSHRRTLKMICSKHSSILDMGEKIFKCLRLLCLYIKKLNDVKAIYHLLWIPAAPEEPQVHCQTSKKENKKQGFYI